VENEELRELLDALDMETYLSLEGVPYKRTRGAKGTQLNVKECPVCGSSSFKVYINADTGLGNCFAGSHPPGEAFNKYSFVKAHLGAPRFSEVISHLKARVVEMGWQPKRKARATETPPELVLPNSIALPHEGQNLMYLVQRGIGNDMAEYFQLRYCQRGWFKYKFDGEDKFQKWDERVIIPVFDLDGKMVTFQGRDITGMAEKKYLFPPGLPSTARFLLNGHNARRCKTIAIGEGAFDVMAMKIAFDEVSDTRHIVPVGSFGKALSMQDPSGNDQLGELLKLKNEGLVEIVMMWDSERDALCSAVEAGLALNGYGFKTRLAVLPADKDPNEVPAAVVRAAFFQAKPITTGMLFLAKMGRSLG
jgi:DNA primase